MDQAHAQLIRNPDGSALTLSACEPPAAAVSGGPPAGGDLTDADGNAYECTVIAGFNDACPVALTVPYGPGGDPSGDYTVSPVESLHSPDGKTVYTIGVEIVPGADGAEYNTVVIAYDAGTGAIRWTQTIQPTPGYYYSCLCRGAALSPDGSRLYLQGVMSGDDNQDAYAAAVDTTTGDVAWLHELTPMLGRSDVRWSSSTGGIGVSADGSRIYLENSVTYEGSLPFNANTDANPWYLSLDAATGDLKWATEYHPQAAQSASGSFFSFSTAALSPDGSRFLAQAAMYGPGGNEGWSIVSVDTATGNLEWVYEFANPGREGHQNPPQGITLSPDGSKVYTTFNTFHWTVGAIDHWTGAVIEEIEHANYTVAAVDTATGKPMWTQEYADTHWTAETGCESISWLSGFKNIIRAHQDRVYVLGNVIPRDDECGDWHAGVLAVDTSTGQPAWATAYSGGDGITHSGCAFFDCWQLVVAPGRGKNATPTVYAVMSFYPRDVTPTASCGGDVPCLSYGLTAGFDGTTGDVTRQLRWIDTFYAPPESENDGGGAFIIGRGGGSVSPAGDRLWVANWEASRPRDWTVIQLLTYNLHGR